MCFINPNDIKAYWFHRDFKIKIDGCFEYKNEDNYGVCERIGKTDLFIKNNCCDGNCGCCNEPYRPQRIYAYKKMLLTIDPFKN